MIRVLIADDHAGLRAALRLFVSSVEPAVEIVGEVEEAAMLLALLPQLTPNLLLLDWELPGLAEPGEQQRFIAELRKQQPHLYIIAFSFLCELEPFILLTGADGFVCKSSHPGELLRALQQAHLNLRHLS